MEPVVTDNKYWRYNQKLSYEPNNLFFLFLDLFHRREPLPLDKVLLPIRYWLNSLTRLRRRGLIPVSFLVQKSTPTHFYSHSWWTLCFSPPPVLGAEVTKPEIEEIKRRDHIRERGRKERWRKVNFYFSQPVNPSFSHIVSLWTLG